MSLQPEDLLNENGKVDTNKVRSIANQRNERIEQIGTETCARWRRKAVGVPNMEQLADSVGASQDTLRRHITGECSHDCDAPTLEYDREYRESRTGSAGKWVVPDE